MSRLVDVFFFFIVSRLFSDPVFTLRFSGVIYCSVFYMSVFVQCNRDLIIH